MCLRKLPLPPPTVAETPDKLFAQTHSTLNSWVLHCILYCEMKPMAKTLQLCPVIYGYGLYNVVIQTRFFSSNFQFMRASFNPCAKPSPVWSSGKNPVCRHRLFISKSSLMKWNVMLMYGSIALLDHKSEVPAKLSTSRNSVSTVS